MADITEQKYFWKTELIVPFWLMPMVDTTLEPYFEGMSWFAVLPDNERGDELEADEPWRLEAVTPNKPNIQQIEAVLALVSKNAGYEIAGITLEQAEERDWIKENLEQFPPIIADDFYVYGSHITGDIPQGKIGIKMDASQAFGTGKHATTKSCLLSLLQLKQQNIDIRTALDMGTGSGILSIAMAKLWNCHILAVDIDELAPVIVKRYAQDNNVSHAITALVGDGYKAKEVVDALAFDCIMANILANPLIDMAPALAQKLKKGGYAILSGFLTQDWDRVQKAHEAQGLVAQSHIIDDNWVALIMQKA